MPQLCSKRVYLPPEAEDGCRVLVDRLWPRGLSRAKAQLDQWQKDLAPSSALRTWFGHRAERFDEFALAYRNELEHNPLASDFAGACRELLRQRNVTLLYAARNAGCNHALVLQAWLSARMHALPDR